MSFYQTARAGSSRARRASRLLSEILAGSPGVALRTWDGHETGPSTSQATIVVRSPRALAWLFRSPGQLGLARAYVAGDLDVEGDIYYVLGLPQRLGQLDLSVRHWLAALRLAAPALLHGLEAPEEEADLHGPRHSLARDRAAISHHYDISNQFYELVLGPSMTYSCAYWKPGVKTLEEAQQAKHDLIAAKLRLAPGVRLLDLGCGWGTLARHAAQNYGATVVGVTLSAQQVGWAWRAQGTGARNGAGTVTIRLQDYREVNDGPYDAISSVGMFEHVGRSRLQTYFGRLYDLLAPGGRLLNHAISALPVSRARQPALAFPSIVPRWLLRRRFGFDRDSFIDRYVFPDGELIELGEVVTAMQLAGFEVLHVESLREHYGPTLRAWVANLERNWDKAVAAVGERRARTWQLYMAASALTFETARTSVHQVLGQKPPVPSLAGER
ncbi:MAG: class I SAM-dependent methyltransferase [Acidimicrobiales bacterium]